MIVDKGAGRAGQAERDRQSGTGREGSSKEAYEFLAQAASHQAAADDLARIIPSCDLARILPRLSALLKACSACHLMFRLERDNRGG